MSTVVARNLRCTYRASVIVVLCGFSLSARAESNDIWDDLPAIEAIDTSPSFRKQRQRKRSVSLDPLAPAPSASDLRRTSTNSTSRPSASNQSFDLAIRSPTIASTNKPKAVESNQTLQSHSLEELPDPPIKVVITSFGDEHPVQAYPALSEVKTAGDWNRIARLNTRIEFKIVPKSRDEGNPEFRSIRDVLPW